MRGLVFRNRELLMPSYVPEALPHRERELNLLESFYVDALRHVEKAYLRVVQIVGSSGTGKTCCVKKFGENFQNKAEERHVPLKHVYMNCQLEASNRFTFYVNLLEKISPEIATRGVSPEEMLRRLIDYLNQTKNYLLISVDDIDYFCKRCKEPLVYDLTRLNELNPGEPCPVIGVVFTAKDMSFHRTLEPAETSTLGRCIIKFPKYDSNQIRDILNQRAEEAFVPGAVSEDVLDFISDITADDFNGDVRVALDLLLYAGNLAENSQCEKVLPEHVRQVYAKTYPWITTSDIANLNETCKLILLAIAQTLKTTGEPYISLSQIRDAYHTTCEQHDTQPVEEKEFEENVQDLCDREILRMKSLLKFGISDAPAEELYRFLDGLMTRLKSGLNEA